MNITYNYIDKPLMPWETPIALEFIAKDKAEWFQKYKLIPFKEYFYKKYRYPTMQSIVTLFRWSDTRPEMNVRVCG